MAKYRVEKHLRCTLTLVYEIAASDKGEAIDIVRADMGMLEPIAESTEIDADPQDTYTATAAV